MSFNAFLGEAVAQQAKAGASDQQIQEMIEDIIGVLKDPIILYPGGWEDSLPPSIWNEITMQRFIQELRAKGKKVEEATDAEALAYIYSVSLVGPMSSEWTNIYLWLGRHMGAKGLERMIPEKLSSDEQRMLTDLKRWIFKKRKASRGKTKAHYAHPLMKKKKSKMGCDECPSFVEAEYA
jgi:hypothetical protein